MSKFNEFEEAIDFSFWRKLCEEHGEPIDYARGQYFIRAGEVMRNVGLILTGGFKHSLTDDEGNEKTVGFVFAGSVLANYVSARFSRPMPTDIVALEDSRVLVMPVKYLKEYMAANPAFHTRFVEILFDSAYRRYLNNYRSSPRERYLQLIDRYPDILSLVSQTEIASYLNISRRQLLRIRESSAR